MLFHVTMTVKIPHDLDRAEAERLKSDERARAQELQRSGKWRHLWRVAVCRREANFGSIPICPAPAKRTVPA